jgi:hypothetical protein
MDVKAQLKEWNNWGMGTYTELDGGILTPEGMFITDDGLHHRMSKGKQERWISSKVIFDYMRNGWKDVVFKRKEEEL